MKATTLWVVFTLFIVIYQVSALPLAPPKEEDVKSGDAPKQENAKEQEKDQGNKEDVDDENESSADEEQENASEDVDSDSNGSASADKPEENEEKERDQRSAEGSGESTAVAQRKSKSAAGSKLCRRCGCGQCGGSWGVCDLCHHPCGEGWCGAGCQCANCCGGFGHPVTNHGCNGGCCPSVTFPCSFGACVNNPCCECCREPAPPGKCKWPCLWPCCCECTPPKFKFKPIKPKPVCHCPHNCCGGHKRSVIAPMKRQLAPVAPAYVPGVHPYGFAPQPYAPAAYGASPLGYVPPVGYAHPYHY